MASLIISSLVSYVTGSTLAGTVASYLVSTLMAPDGPDTHGYRLSNLTTQSNTEGFPIKKVYGTSRIAGNLIWSEGIQETSHTQSTGGKGGGGGGSHTTYTYSASFAVGLCEGPIIGVKRIWADSVLIYDKGDSATADELAVSDQLGITIYTGSEDQEADPLMEADKGSGNVPAYRGLAYVVFDTLQLEKYGNRIPNITCEVVANGSIAYSFSKENQEYPAPINYNELAILDSSLRVVYPGNTTTYVLDSEANYISYESSVPSDHFPGSDNTYPSNGGMGIGTISGIDIFINTYRIGQSLSYPTFKIYTNTGTVLSDSIPVSNGYVIGATIDTTKSFLFVITNETSGYTGNATKWWKIDISGNILNSGNCLGLPGDVYAYGFSNRCIFHYGAAIFDSLTDTLWTVYGAGGGHVKGFKIIDNTLNYKFFNTIPVWNFTKPSIWAEGSKVWLLSGNSSAFYLNTSKVSIANIDLSDIISDICSKTEMTDIDVSSLSKTLHGYVRSQPMTAREALEPLLQAYQLTAIESDYQLKFEPMHGTSDEIVPEIDLGASENHSTLIDKLRISRKQGVELPRRLEVVYSDKDGDYQQGNQFAQRIYK